MRINKEVVNTIVDFEMSTVKGMKKAHLFQLVRELLEERTLEMEDGAIQEYYNDIILGKI
jgi:hypothetical protein